MLAYSRKSAICALVIATCLLVASCASGSGSADQSSSVSASTAAPCVADVDAVIATGADRAAWTDALPADLVAILDKAAAAAFDLAAAPGAVVGVRTPQGTWIQAYGEADPDAQTPMSPDTHQRIGSVTKTFTGTVLLQLAERGRLSLDDPIGQYVPGIPNGDRITLRRLANMTSGIASYTASEEFTTKYFTHPDTVFKVDELIAIGAGLSPIFEPGAEFNYSNTNTVLLGKVIEIVTGKAIGEVFQEMVFDPLGLSNTSWPGDSPVLPDPHARGFTLQGMATPEQPADATNWNPAWGSTAGEMVSTIADLLTYGRAMGTGAGLLSPETQAERLTTFDPVSHYGLAIGCIGGWVGHNGELPGYNTSLFYDTTTDTVVAIAVNSDIASGDCTQTPTLVDNPADVPCSAPAVRMLVGVTTALGHPFEAPSST